MLDIRTAQNVLEDVLRDTILYAMGKRLPAVSTVAALRAISTQGASGSALHDDALIPIVVASVVTVSYRWTQTSSAADNGTTVIKPNDVSGPGRWIAWTSPLRFSPVVGGDAFYLHEIELGFLERVIVLDASTTKEQVNSLIFGQVPSVMIQASGDSPEDATYGTGHRWFTDFTFTVTSLDENERDRRQATHGSGVDGTVGVNLIDGFLQALLGGTVLFEKVDGIRNVQLGKGFNWVTDQGQRRVARNRDYTLQVTVENPAAPNDAGLIEEVDFQPQMTSPGDDVDEQFDLDNYVSLGLCVSIGVGLSKTITTGQAYIAGVLINFTGGLHTFTASKDTYRDLLPSGSLVFIETVIDDIEPAVTATALRIGVTRTDGSSVLSDRFIAPSRIPYGPIIQTPLT